MQMLDPLAFMKIRALSRHIFHVPRIHQTRFDPVLFQHVVHWNPIHTRGLHSRAGDATDHQPIGHLLQISGKCSAPPNRIRIPSGGTATKISLAPMSMPAAFGSNIEPPGCPDRFGCLLRWPLADTGPRRPCTSCCCVFMDMPIPFALATGQAAQTKVLF